MDVTGRFNITFPASGGFPAATAAVKLTRALISVSVEKKPPIKILNTLRGKSNVEHRHVGYTMSFTDGLLTEGLGGNKERLDDLYHNYGIALQMQGDFCKVFQIYIDDVDHTRDEILNYVRHLVTYLHDGKLPPKDLMAKLKSKTGAN